jgi:DNA-binding response OmpR family regulator
MRILIVEDNKNLAETLKDTLKHQFVVDLAFNGNDGTYLAQVNTYDLMIIDIMLPDIDGIEVCRMTRTAGIKTPILMLTAKTKVEHKVSSLDSGADDYLTKPFSYEELTARIRALLRRNPEITAPNKLIFGDITMDMVTKITTVCGSEISLRKKERQLLEFFMRNSNRVLSTETILESVWELGLEVPSNTVRVHVGALRTALNKYLSKPIIHTVHGVGYKLME